ncbi:MAG: hypothetical protein JW909_02750 [Planctomycetes bacterium]|nr:hypothetical protein [Planctomycetota bacterium]
MSRRGLLMDDRFESLRPGLIKEVVDGAFREMHAQPAHPDDNLGGWMRKIGNWDIGKDPWEVVETGEGKLVRSNATALVYDNVSLAKGDYDWQDVSVESWLRLREPGDGWGGPAGIIFRFLDAQRYYAACIDEDGYAKILRRVENVWDTLAWKPFQPQLGVKYSLHVEVRGSRIKASVAGIDLEADDGWYTHGCVGFVGARPSEFGPVTVRALRGETARYAAQKKEKEARLTSKRARFGRPVVWKKYDTPRFGAGRRIRIGDLTGDGTCDFLLIQTNSYEKRGTGCLTAMSSKGEVLWQLGKPSGKPEMESSGDTPTQIHDIDGDGRNEVVCSFQDKLMILEGSTGKLKHEAELPPMSPYPKVFKENILDWGAGFSDTGPTVVPSAICFADLAGKGRRSNVLLTDHYHMLVAMDEKFNELWRDVTSHGHFPQPYDFDGDGRDDVLAGYHHLSPNGRLVGRVCLQDHQDATYAGVVPLDDEGNGPVRILMSAGEDGLLALTPGYAIRQRVMGHVQRLSLGKFRKDVPGTCVATVLYHGSPGIVSLFDSTLKKIWTRDYPVVGATLQPVNWDGSGTELMFLSGMRPAQGFGGGLMDGDGDMVVPLPDDGGPGFCAFAYDFDGDGLDELMVWDYDRIWIYHTDAAVQAGRKYRPKRPPLYNMSNFQSYWSLPNWE